MARIVNGHSNSLRNIWRIRILWMKPAASDFHICVNYISRYRHMPKVLLIELFLGNTQARKIRTAGHKTLRAAGLQAAVRKKGRTKKRTPGLIGITGHCDGQSR